MAILNQQSATRSERTSALRRWDPPTVLASWRIVIAALCLTSACLSSTAPRAQAQEPNTEYQLKAAFLYNFAKFVEWPAETFANTAAPFTICALGSDPFGASLDALAGKTVREHPLIVKRIRSAAGVTGCQILYVSPNELLHTPDLLRNLQDAPILTVCDRDACAEEGLMLNMRMADTRVQLDINLDAVQHTMLKVSSQLIKLTRIVKGQP